MEAGKKFTSVEEYFQAFAPAVQKQLQHVHNAVLAAAPGAESCISYNMPAFKYKGVLVYYAAFKNHIGFYPTASGITQFAPQIKAYKTSKGAIQFPIEETIPVELIRKIVAFRVKENEQKAIVKKKAKT